MATLTPTLLRERLADHAAAEAMRNAPKAQAIRAIYTLSSLLAELDDDARATVLHLLATEVRELRATA